MTFKEFREKHDHYSAYIDWESVHDAKQSGLIPEAYHAYFPDLCECGSENMIKNNLKQITCCNPKCYQKEACQMSEFMTRSNIDGFGDATCMSILEQFRDADERKSRLGEKTLFPTGGFLDIFAVPEEMWPLSVGSALERNFAAAIERLKSENITFPELISRLGIGSLGGNALKIFDGISCAKELANSIEENGGVRFFCYTRGVYAPEVINNIYESLIDIANAERIFHTAIRHQGLVSLNVCITGSSALRGNSLTKTQLIDVFNRASIGSSGIQYFEFHMCTALQSAPFILYTVPSGTAKFRAGEARGNIVDEFGEHSVLMQIDDFYDLLRKHVSELDEEVERMHKTNGEKEAVGDGQ